MARRGIHLALLAGVFTLWVYGQSGTQSAAPATPEHPTPEHATPDQAAASDPDIPIEDQPTNNPAQDAELIRKIRAALKKDKATARYCFDIQITPYVGKVKLEGAVPTQEIRHEIEQRTRAAVKGMSGLQVKDEIEVQPRNWRAAR
ncbi:MAG TPA: BON domain-containing protein [Bryobacteraceae bacterium]|jgi:osmotically-inducible protein OsmY